MQKVENLEDWLQRLEKEFNAAKDSVAYAQQRMIERENAKRRLEKYYVGDKVLLSVSRKKQLLLHIPGHNSHGKLGPRWIGLYAITQKISPLAYKLDLLAHFSFHPVFHIDRLKR